MDSLFDKIPKGYTIELWENTNTNKNQLVIKFGKNEPAVIDTDKFIKYISFLEERGNLV